jgi:hypothetical protein
MQRVLYSGSIGLNNKVAPHRLQYSAKTGVSALEAADNVIIDRTGEIVTRRGTELVQSGNYHSMWSVPGGFYVVEDRDADSALMFASVADDGSIGMTGIRSGLARGKRVSYADLDNSTLYCNGTQNGQLIDFVSSPWPVSEWTGSSERIEKIKAPVGEHIDVLSGRDLISVADELFATEYGLPGIVDANSTRRRLDGRIIAVVSVQSGAFVSTTDAIYFISGTSPSKWTMKKVLDYPALEWGNNQTLINPSDFGLESYTLSALFATVNGPVVGFPDGTAINLIDKNVTTPNCSSGAIMVVDETMIIQSGV